MIVKTFKKSAQGQVQCTIGITYRNHIFTFQYVMCEALEIPLKLSS